MFDLSNLNDEQREAVQTTEGAVLVLAGAGTGKTRVLTSRLAYIVAEKLCEINQILAVTFTNKAAKEMKERAISLLNQCGCVDNSGELLWIGTFHALALRMIRPFYGKFDRTANFTIIDAGDQLRLIKRVIHELGIDEKKHTPKQLAYYINRWKDQCKGPEDARKIAARFTVEEVASEAYPPYQDLLTSLDAIDFGDILRFSIDILKYNPDVLERYQNKFRYIMVDEYQDTNVAQYMWLKLLSMGHGNICCVGDDDQSIYSWRGADVGNILKFDKDFKNPSIIRLGQNYRSTKNIINAASGLISNNSMRMQKKFWTEQDAGLPIVVKSLQDPVSEAYFIAELMENKHRHCGVQFSDMAILVRAAFQTRSFEERLLAMGIPYTVVGGVKFYERKEVKDAIAYLKLVVNPNDGVAFERIVNLPKRGIGTTSINKFYAMSRGENISLPAAAKKIADSSNSASLSRLSDFFNKIESWRENLEYLQPFELMENILEGSGYLRMLEESKTIENEARIETLGELVNALRDFENVQEFLDYISLVLDNSDSVTSDKVVISTIHAAKGLEYHTVFIPGFEENILPHQKSIAEKGDLGIEEERRLCYVALTRAKKEAYITLCNMRNSYGAYSSRQYTSPSRFLYDLPKSCVKII